MRSKTISELDVLLPSAKIGIEFNCDYWHSKLVKKDPLADHSKKLAACRGQGIVLLFVWDHDWLHHRASLQEELFNFLRLPIKTQASVPLRFSQLLPSIDLPRNCC